MYIGGSPQLLVQPGARTAFGEIVVRKSFQPCDFQGAYITGAVAVVYDRTVKSVVYGIGQITMTKII